MPLRNTGFLERRQIDQNPLSPTFGQERWVADAQPSSTCPTPLSSTTTYDSQAISQFVYRSNCPPGQSATPVLYSLAAGFKTSTVSQSDADAQAKAHFDYSKEAFANLNASCS